VSLHVDTAAVQWHFSVVCMLLGFRKGLSIPYPPYTQQEQTDHQYGQLVTRF